MGCRATEFIGIGDRITATDVTGFAIIVFIDSSGIKCQRPVLDRFLNDRYLISIGNSDGDEGIAGTVIFLSLITIFDNGSGGNRQWGNISSFALIIRQGLIISCGLAGKGVVNGNVFMGSTSLPSS